MKKPSDVEKSTKIETTIVSEIKEVVSIPKANASEIEPKYTAILHKDWDINDERQEWLNYAYRIGGIDFVLTLLAENGNMVIDLKSYSVGANGYSDYGICQINSGYHPEILSDGTNGKYLADWMYDPYKQLDHCWYKYSTGTKFYGHNVREKQRYKIIYD